MEMQNIEKGRKEVGVSSWSLFHISSRGQSVCNRQYFESNSLSRASLFSVEGKLVIISNLNPPNPKTLALFCDVSKFHSVL